MAVEGSKLHIGGVSVGVKVNDGDSAKSHVVRYSGDIRQGDAVIATQDDGDDVGGRELRNLCFESRERQLRVTRRHLDITDIHDA